MEYRCPSRIQAVLDEDGLLEFKCSSKHCGAGGGTIVFHYFDPTSAKLVRTKKFRDFSTASSSHKEKSDAAFNGSTLRP